MTLPSGESATEQVIARFGKSGLFIYLSGGVIHAVFLLIFALIDQWVLAYYNVFSVALFALAGVLHTRGYVVTALLLTVLEVPIHGALATVILGSEPGFYFYLAMTPIGAWVYPFFGRRARIFIVAVSSLAFAFLAAYSVYFEAISPLADGWAFGFKMANALGFVILVVGWIGFYNDAMLHAEAALAVAHERSEKLLRNILPSAIADRLKDAARTIGDHHDAATVLFADIVGFTEMARRMPAASLVRLLNDIFTEFDDLAAEHGLEKIKTIGDAYMVAGGLPEAQPDHAARIARYALAIRGAVARHRDDRGAPIQIRIGINSGPVVAGVIGKRKFAYDLWGDAVNIAARMEESADAGTIQVSAATQALLMDEFRFGRRDDVAIKGVGAMTVYRLEGPLGE
jgi:class 3 adenylate cyclase